MNLWLKEAEIMTDSVQSGAPKSVQTHATSDRPWYFHPVAIIITAVLIAIVASFLTFTPQGAAWMKSLRASGTAVPMAVAPAASAAETAASAAAQAEPQPAAADAATEPKTYTVEKDDWLSLVFPNDWKSVCELNRDILKKGCGHIVEGQVLKLPEGVQATEKSARARKPQGKKVVKTEKPQASRAVLPKTNAAGEILYARVGAAPLNGCGKRDIADISKEAWNVLGLSEDDQAYLVLNADLKYGPRINATAHSGIVQLVPDMRLDQVTFCRKGKVVAIGPMRTAWNQDTAVYGERFVLPSGKLLVWMRNCFNWVILPEEKKALPVPPPLPEEPPIEPLPPELPVSVPLPVVPPPTVAEAPKGLCDWIDMAGALGQHHVPRQNGDKASSDFLTFVLDCQQRLESNDGSWGIGGKAEYSAWHGTANRGVGKYEGWNYKAMVSYRQIMDEGYDWGVAAGVGHQRERYHQDKYASRSDYDLVTVSLVHNDYRRRMAGETWDVERQYYGGITIPIASELSHTWNGEKIADTSGMGRLKFGVQAGARWWFYESQDLPFLPYLEGGLFVQHPTSASGNAMIGIADPARICGIGIGIDQDFQNGGNPVGAWGWNCDPFQGARVVRSKYRKHQVITDAARRGVTIEEKDGYIQSIRFGPEWLKTQGLTIVPAPDSSKQ